MSCKINIRALTDTLIGNKDWLRNTDYRTVFISESPKHKINDNNLLGAVKTYANEWNEAIRKVMPELSSGIYYAGLYMDSSKYMVMPGIQIRIPDHVQKELDIAGERIMKERIEAAKEKDRKDARKIQEEDAKRAGVEYTKEYLANKSRIEVADFVKLPEIRDVRTEWFNGKTSMSIKEFLTTVKENHPAYDKLVTYLLKNLSNDTEIQLVDFIAGKDGVITHGLYNPNDNKIKLSETSMNRKQNAVGTALHEILHAQTYHALQNNPELRTKMNDKIAYIKTQLNIGEDYYGLTNADEFVASLFTNSRFAKRLQEIPATNKTSISLFDQILQMFFEFLGFVKGTSVYLEAAKLVTEVIEKQYQETLEFENALEAQGYEAADMFDRMITNNNVQYTFRAVNILQSDRAKQIFDKGNKNKWSLDKILTELAIPKEQKALLLDLGITDREQLIIDLVSKYGFNVEINTAKENAATFNKVQGYDTTKVDIHSLRIEESDWGNSYIIVDKDGNHLTPLEYTKEEAEEILAGIGKINTQYYSNLSAPGGTGRNKYEGNPDWEYQELEFKTPLITPSIKGHAQFATEQGIGWARVWYNKKTGTVEIQEIQSDLFQKGRNKENIVEPIHIEIINTGDIFHNEAFKFILDKDVYESVVEMVYYVEENQSEPTERYYKNGEPISSQEMNTAKQKYIKDNDDVKPNQFLQLLNKDNNWVTFFVKSIIQDSAKKGYEKVLFPKGETAAKIEGHETLANEIKRIDNEISSFKEDKGGKIILGNPNTFEEKTLLFKDNQEKDKFISDNKRIGYTDIINISFNQKNTLEQLQQKKQELKSQGIEKLKPIEAFYEIKVGNILEKQYGKDNVKTITDEYGNQWREITITEDMQDTILFDRTNDNIKEGVSELFESNPELANIGTQEQYSKYLDTIFPDYINNFAYEAVEEFLVANKIIDRKC